MSSISKSNDGREESAVSAIAIDGNTEYEITPTNSTDGQEQDDTGPKKMISDYAQFTTVVTRIVVSIFFIIVAVMPPPPTVAGWWIYVIAMMLFAVSINEERRAKVFAPFDDRWLAELGRRSSILTSVGMLLIPATMITGKYIEIPRVEMYGWITASVLVVFGQTVLAVQYFRTKLNSLFVAHFLSILGTLAFMIPTCFVLYLTSEITDATDSVTDAFDALDSISYDFDDDFPWYVPTGSILVFQPTWKIFTLPGFCLYIIHGPLFAYAFLKAKKRSLAPVEGGGDEDICVNEV